MEYNFDVSLLSNLKPTGEVRYIFKFSFQAIHQQSQWAFYPSDSLEKCLGMMNVCLNYYKIELSFNIKLIVPELVSSINHSNNLGWAWPSSALACFWLYFHIYITFPLHEDDSWVLLVVSETRQFWGNIEAFAPPLKKILAPPLLIMALKRP